MKAFAATVRSVKAAGRTFYRVVVAHANRAQYSVAHDGYVQSFAPKYRVCESGDYCQAPDDGKAKAIIAKAMQFAKIDPSSVEWM